MFKERLKKSVVKAGGALLKSIPLILGTVLLVSLDGDICHLRAQ